MQQPNRTLRSRDKGEIVWESHPSSLGMLGWYVKWGGVALGVDLAILLAAHFGALSMLIAVPVCLAVLGGVYGIAKLMLLHTTYQVTRNRVYTHTGILRKRVESAPINRIENVTVDQSLVDRLLKVGRVDFDTAGEHVRALSGGRVGEQPYLDWWGIRHPEMVAALVDELLTHEDLLPPQRIRARARQRYDDAEMFRDGPFDGADMPEPVRWRDADDVHEDDLGDVEVYRDDIVRYD